MERVQIEYMGTNVDLPYGETIVGRDVACTLRLNDPAVSRRHMRLIRRQDDLFVEDLGSSNGTLVNGRRITAPLRIVDGDILTVASRELTIRVLEGEDMELASTLVLQNKGAFDQIKKSAEITKVTDITTFVGRPTAQIPVVQPPPSANQRCPNCAAPVSEDDDECSNCHFQWGSFRPMSRTDVRPHPLNRRRHDRQPIELHLVYSSNELEVETVSRDLSISGVMVCSQVLDPVGTLCQLTILVDGGPPILVKGIVRRVVEREENGEPIGLGVEFLSVGQSELAWIKAAIARTAADDEI